MVADEVHGAVGVDDVRVVELARSSSIEHDVVALDGVGPVPGVRVGDLGVAVPEFPGPGVHRHREHPRERRQVLRRLVARQSVGERIVGGERPAVGAVERRRGRGVAGPIPSAILVHGLVVQTKRSPGFIGGCGSRCNVPSPSTREGERQQAAVPVEHDLVALDGVGPATVVASRRRPRGSRRCQVPSSIVTVKIHGNVA